jgi:hypothetical protein
MYIANIITTNADFWNVTPYHVAEFTDILQEPAASIFRASKEGHYGKWA